MQAGPRTRVAFNQPGTISLNLNDLFVTAYLHLQVYSIKLR
jgi:hypothetical protein